MTLNGTKIDVLHVEKIMNFMEVNFVPKNVMKIILFQNLINFFVNVCGACFLCNVSCLDVINYV